MEKDSNKYNLEEFFRNQLENYDAAENGWNVPPDTVWEEAASRIREETKTSRINSIRKYLPFIGIAFFSLFAFQFVKNIQKVDQLSTELESIKTALASSQERIQELSEQRDNLYRFKGQPQGIDAVSSGNSETNKPNEAAPVSPAGSMTRSLSTTQSTKRIFSEPDPPVQEQSLDLKNSAAATPPSAVQNPASSTSQAAAEIDNTDLALFRPLPGLPFSDLQAQKKALDIEPVKTAQRKLSHQARIKGTAGPMLVSRNLTNPPEDFERKDDHQFRGINAGLNLEWPLSYRWYVESGINYTRYAANSVHERHFHYSHSDENIPGLDPHDSYRHKSFHGPFGYVDTRLTLSRQPGSTVSSHNRIDMTVRASSQVDYLSVPLLLNYRITLGRMGVLLRGGFFGSAQIGQKYAIENVEIDHEHLQFKRGETLSDFENLKPFHFQYLVGTGVEYWITPQYALHFESSFSRSLADISSIEDVPIRLQSIGIYGGLKLHF